MTTTPVPPAATAKIRFDEVSKSFGTRRAPIHVLDKVSFAIRDSEFVSVLGPSGCGKSTLMTMAAGFLNPDSGEVRIDDRVVTGPDPSRGIVFQQYAIFPWLNVWDNIAFGLRVGPKKAPKAEIAQTVEKYVALMGLQGFEKSLPKTLSGGMRQRVAIARAYATRPDVLLMDEPFAALDAQTRVFMQELLHQANQEERRTAMFITHSVEEAIFLSHTVVVMTARPSSVCEVVPVPLDLPRSPATRTDPRFVELRARLESMLRTMSADSPTATPQKPTDGGER